MTKLFVEKLIRYLYHIPVIVENCSLNCYLEGSEIHVNQDFRNKLNLKLYVMALLHEVGHTYNFSKYNQHEAEFEADLFAVEAFSKIFKKQEALDVFNNLSKMFNDVDTESHPSRAKRLANVYQINY